MAQSTIKYFYICKKVIVTKIWEENIENCKKKVLAAKKKDYRTCSDWAIENVLEMFVLFHYRWYVQVPCSPKKQK